MDIEETLRSQLVIKRSWGINITSVTEFSIPRKTWLRKGPAAAHGEGYPGGGYQAVASNLPRAWTTRPESAYR